MVIPNAYISAGFRGAPPLSRSGAIQFRLPVKPLPGRAERLVASAFIRERPKSHKTARLPSSMRTFSCQKECNEQWKRKVMKRHYSFEVTVYNIFGVKIDEPERYVMKL